MKVLHVKQKWFSESDLRLDASYHLNDGPLTKLKLKNLPYEVSSLLNETKKIFKGNIFKRTYVKNSDVGYKFMTASDMMKTNIDSGTYVSKKYTKVANLMLEKNWILVSRSGTLGNTVFTNDDFEGVLGTDDLIRIVPLEKNILSGFMYAFLASKYGYGLLTQSGYGGVIQHIEPHHIEDLPIPIFPEEKQKVINNLIIEANKLRVEANKALNEAKELFNDYKNLSSKEIFTVKKNTLNDSWLGRNNRPEISEYDKKVKNDGYKELSWFAQNVYAPPMFKHIYIERDNGYPFYNGAEISRSRRVVNRFLSERGVKDINDYVVKKGTLLIYRHGPRNGMLGDVFIVDDFLNNACLSDLVIRVKTKLNKYSYWLFTFFSTKIGREILHNIASGSAILFLSPNRLNSIKVPYNGENDIDLNYKLIKQYLEKINEANIKENQAIDLIEKEIDAWQ
ncbi:methylation-associated defense system restriction endonuclease subunit S MAD5 [Flavobacterium haoranii]|uniref:Restriction endonuclease S subunit n=1 Tax=Flavobacterium haoranii TaxID=683124 RepID=A0A1M6C0T1_9FLAO|nr:restriction endonuclease subunit S [Flavobacterium haoranii]SHI54597.1 Restriction endonuclease S subunit [Flavobacterium haoranii]